jgi:hypothetical protein
MNTGITEANCTRIFGSLGKSRRCCTTIEGLDVEDETVCQGKPGGYVALFRGTVSCRR